MAAAPIVAGLCGVGVSIGDNSAACAATYWWDKNDSAPGAGAAPSGLWIDAAWSTDSAGGATPQTWPAAGVHIPAFSAGSDATAPFNIIVVSDHAIGGMIFEEGTPSIAGGAALNISGAAVFDVQQSTAKPEVNVVLGGTGSLTKTGPGTLVLGSANTYPGGTTVSQGTLELSNSGSVVGNVVNNGTVRLVESPSFAGVISGTGNVRIAGPALSSTTLTAVNTYAGGTSVTGGVALRLSTNTSVGSGAITVGSNSGLQLLNAVTITNPLVLAGSTTGNGALFNNGPTAGGGFSGAVTLNANSGVGGTHPFTISGNITGNGGLTKLGANTITLTGTTLSYNGPTNVSAGTLLVAQSASGNRVLQGGALSIASTGRLDIKNNKLITTSPAGTASGGVYTGVQREVQRASNGGLWDQPGLTTSMPAATSGLTSIGVATGEQIRGLGPADTDTFAGQTITGASTIVMYTYAGDANLDGAITGDDYSSLDFAIATPGASGWFNGDFNYDGVISGDDYSVIDFNIVAQGAPFPTASGDGLTLTAVPEPSAALAVVGTLCGIVLRRRRRAFTAQAVSRHLFRTRFVDRD